MSYYRIINSLKWYYRLKPQKEDNINKKGLFSDVPRHQLSNALIVSLSWKDPKDGKEYRLFTHFKSYLEYGIFQRKLPEHERCFYEIILGESSQKPHFDIDIDDPEIDGDKIRDALIDAIIIVLQNKNVTLNLSKDLLLYTSHSSASHLSGPPTGGSNSSGSHLTNPGVNNNKKKQSYHVVVNNYCHANNIEAKAFYHHVTEKMSPENAKWVDMAVYNPTQQFRIVGSRKIGSDRVKKFNKNWKYHDQEIEHEYPEKPEDPDHEYVMQLEESMVGFCGSCRFLPPFDPRADQMKTYQDSEDVTQEEAIEAIKLVGKAGNIDVNDSRFPYKFLGINGPIIMLKRTKASKCKICNRVHENENPYLLVVGDEKNVYFCCRRSNDGKKLFLGKLNELPFEQTQVGIDNEKLNQVKINWTKNVVEKVQEIARSGKVNEKRFISGATPIDSNHKKQLIEMYVNSKSE